MARRQRGRGFGDMLSKGANLAKKGFAAADDAGLDLDGSDNPLAGLSTPATAPPGLMSGIQSAMNAAPSDPQAGLVDLAKTMSRDDVDKVQRLAAADAENRAAGGPGVLPGGRRTRRRRSKKSRKTIKSRGRRRR